MPTYEYQCGTCGNRFEKYQSFSDEPVKVCPECGNEVRKVFSAAGIIFKGSGWYINDSRKATSSTVGSKSETKAETAGENKSEAKAEASSEAKSETKTETKPEAKKEAAA